MVTLSGPARCRANILRDVRLPGTGRPVEDQLRAITQQIGAPVQPVELHMQRVRRFMVPTPQILPSHPPHPMRSNTSPPAAVPSIAAVQAQASTYNTSSTAVVGVLSVANLLRVAATAAC